MMSILLSLFFLLFLSPSLSARCNLRYIRTVTPKPVWVATCECNTPRQTVGRVQTSIPASLRDSAAATQTTLKCLRPSTSSLTHACLRSPARFQHLAASVLDHCAREKPNAMMRKMFPGPFTFERAGCRATFIEVTQPIVGAVLICNCQQKGWRAVAGRSGWYNEGKAGGRKEIRGIRACVKGSMGELTRFCRKGVEGWEELALSVIRVCCKRERVGDPEGEKMCDEEQNLAMLLEMAGV